MHIELNEWKTTAMSWCCLGIKWSCGLRLTSGTESAFKELKQAMKRTGYTKEPLKENVS